MPDYYVLVTVTGRIRVKGQESESGAEDTVRGMDAATIKKSIEVDDTTVHEAEEVEE